MVIDEQAIQHNLERYGPFAATERLLMGLVAKGASRQDGHEWIRESSLKAWSALRQGEENPLMELLVSDARITRFLRRSEIDRLMDYGAYTGTAEERARALARTIWLQIDEA